MEWNYQVYEQNTLSLNLNYNNVLPFCIKNTFLSNDRIFYSKINYI